MLDSESCIILFIETLLCWIGWAGSDHKWPRLLTQIFVMMLSDMPLMQPLSSGICKSIHDDTLVMCGHDWPANLCIYHKVTDQLTYGNQATFPQMTWHEHHKCTIIAKKYCHCAKHSGNLSAHYSSKSYNHLCSYTAILYSIYNINY